MYSYIFLAATTLVSISVADVLDALPKQATPWAEKRQPILDFDKDVCKFTAAINSAGQTNPGSGSEASCDNFDRMPRSNVYSRQCCNHGWCAFMYGYYAEMDNGWNGIEAHTHDWEHAIVWTKDDQFVKVYWSAHGGYKGSNNPRFDESTHPKLVYHHGTFNSASLRLAEPDDDEIESGWGGWRQADLVSKEVVSGDLWNILAENTDWGSAHPDFSNERFWGSLGDTMPDAARADGFQLADDGSHL